MRVSLMYQKQKEMTQVNHPTLGKGQVISFDENNITVNFNGTLKTLVIKFSKLTNENGSVFGSQFIAPVKKAKKLNQANFMSHEEYMKTDTAKMSKDDFEDYREAKKRASHSTFY